MANIHDKFVVLATRLINKHGRTVSLKVVKTVPTTDKPWNGATTSTELLRDVRGVQIPYKGYDFGSVWEDFDLTKVADNIVLVAGIEGADLSVAHVLEDSGKPFKIQWVQILKPGDVTILYAFGVNQ